MRHNPRQLPPTIRKHHPIRPRTASSEDFIRVQEREFLVGARDVEVDALVVVLRVRVVVAADFGAGLVVFVALGDGGVDVGSGGELVGRKTVRRGWWD